MNFDSQAPCINMVFFEKKNCKLNFKKRGGGNTQEICSLLDRYNPHSLAA
jgi:hypothetical protein